LKFQFPKPVHVEMKSLPAHLPFCIVCYWSPNFFKLWKSAFTTWYRKTMLKCRDW